MPTYQYACTDPGCGATFERVQSFTDPAVSECPVCGRPVRKVYSSVGVVFKGSGFYRTDSRSEARANGARNGAKQAAGSSGSASTPASGSDASSNGASSDSAAKNGSTRDGSAKTGSKDSRASAPDKATTSA